MIEPGLPPCSASSRTDAVWRNRTGSSAQALDRLAGSASRFGRASAHRKDTVMLQATGTAGALHAEGSARGVLMLAAWRLRDRRRRRGATRVRRRRSSARRALSEAATNAWRGRSPNPPGEDALPEETPTGADRTGERKWRLSCEELERAGPDSDPGRRPSPRICRGRALGDLGFAAIDQGSRVTSATL